MTVRVWSALMTFPKVAVFRLNVTIQSTCDDEVTCGLELLVLWACSSEHSFDQAVASFLHQLEQNAVLDDSHLDDFSKPVSKPASLEGLEELPVRDGHNWRVERAEQVLVAVAITARSGRRACIDATNNRSAEHDVRGSSVIKAASKSCKVGNHTTTNYENWFISLCSVTLVVFENFLHTADVLVSFMCSVDKLD